MCGRVRVQIDILVDLTGWTVCNRLDIFACSAAPVQVQCMRVCVCVCVYVFLCFCVFKCVCACV